MSNILTFDGNLKTVSPFTVQQPNKKLEFPMTVDGQPMIKSSTIRGWLRHSVHFAVSDLSNEQGVKFNLANHHMMGLGQDVNNLLSKKSQNERKLFNRKQKEQNPFFAVFGCWLSGGRLVVNNAVAAKGTKVQEFTTSTSSNLLKTDHGILSHIDPEQITGLDEVLLAKTISKDTSNKLKKEIKALQEKMNKNSVSKDFERLIQNSIKNLESKLSNIELLNANSSDRICNKFLGLSDGVCLKHGFRLNNPSENDFMFLIWTLFVSSKQPMGGKVNQGFGQIEFEYDIYHETLFSLDRKLIGSVGYTYSQGFYINAVDDINSSQALISKAAFDINKIQELLIQNAQLYGKFI